MPLPSPNRISSPPLPSPRLLVVIRMILILSATKRLNTKGVVVELRSRKNVLVGELITMKFMIAITLIVMVKVSHSFSLSLRKPSCFISLS